MNVQRVDGHGCGKSNSHPNILAAGPFTTACANEDDDGVENCCLDGIRVGVVHTVAPLNFL